MSPACLRTLLTCPLQRLCPVTFQRRGAAEPFPGRTLWTRRDGREARLSPVFSDSRDVVLEEVVAAVDHVSAVTVLMQPRESSLRWRWEKDLARKESSFVASEPGPRTVVVGERQFLSDERREEDVEERREGWAAEVAGI